MHATTHRSNRSTLALFRSTAAVLALLASPCAVRAADPAWYTAGVGGFNPNIPDFYQHQDWQSTGVAAANGLGTSVNGWESSTDIPGGTAAGWCFFTAFDDIFYDLTQQGYTGLYNGAPDPTAGGGANWYSATYGPATLSNQEQYAAVVTNNSGNPADDLSLIYTGTGGSVNNLGTPVPGLKGFTPAGTSGVLNGVGGVSANGFTLNFSSSLPNGATTAALFTASPGIQFNSGSWSYKTMGPVALDATRDEESLVDLGGANVVQSDIYNVVQGMSKFDTTQEYLDATVGAGKLKSQVWPINATTGTVQYYAPNGAGKFALEDTGKSVVTFLSNVESKVAGEAVIKLLPPSTIPANNGNGQGLWWGQGALKSFHFMAVAGINTTTNTFYVADPDSNPTNPAGPTGGAVANGGWPTTDTNFPGGNTYNNLTTPSNAGLPVPAAPAFNTPASYNQNYAAFQMTGTKNYVWSSDSPQYGPGTAAGQLTNDCTMQNISTITPTAVKLVSATPEGAGKEETSVTVSLPADAGDSVSKILIEPSSDALNTGSNAPLFSFDDASEPSSTWSDTDDTSDPFGNSLPDDGIEYDLANGNGLEPGESATIDLGTDSEFANEGYDVLLYFAPDADDPSGTWLPEMEDGSELDSSDVPQDQELPEPTAVAFMALGAVGVAARRKRAQGPTD